MVTLVGRRHLLLESWRGVTAVLRRQGGHITDVVVVRAFGGVAVR